MQFHKLEITIKLVKVERLHDLKLDILWKLILYFI